jgi:glutathione S-transferase
MKVHIYFPNDPTVGFMPTYYDAEFPDVDADFKEEYREQIKRLYEEMDGEMSCKVYFEGELL